MPIETERMRQKTPPRRQWGIYFSGHELTPEMKQSLEETKALDHLFARLAEFNKKPDGEKVKPS